MLHNNAKAHGKLSNHSNECQADEDEYMNINTAALLHVIETLWKENRNLRSQLIRNDRRNYEYYDQHNGYAAGNYCKKNSRAGQRYHEKAQNRASTHNNQCTYAEVSKMNIQINKVNSQSECEEKEKSIDENEAVKSKMTEKNMRSCKYCGLVHIFGSNNCTAFGKSCNTCKKMNHFARVCKNRRKKYMFNHR